MPARPFGFVAIGGREGLFLSGSPSLLRAPYGGRRDLRAVLVVEELAVLL